MTPGELRTHPAYLALEPHEREAVDRRLELWPLDSEVLAAVAGGVDTLEPDDLRFWLARTALRPGLPLAPCPAPELALAILDHLLGPGRDAGEPLRLARAFARAAATVETERRAVGLVREDALSALDAHLARLCAGVPSLDPDAVIDHLAAAGLPQLAEALATFRGASMGAAGFMGRLTTWLGSAARDATNAVRYLLEGNPEHEGRFAGGTWRNWNEEHAVAPARFVRPATEEALRRAVAEASRLRVVGGGHSFNDSPLCDDTLLSLDEYDAVLDLDPVGRTARVGAGIRLRDLNQVLWQHGLALPLLGSTDVQSLGGVLATDVHGTGRDRGFISESVRTLRVIAHDGTAQTVAPGSELFHAAIGGLGACGVVSEVELALVPAFHLVKMTEMVDRAEVEAGMDTLLAENEHLSLYYVGGAELGQSVRMHRWNRTDEPLTPDWAHLKTRGELTDFAISAFVPEAAVLLADVHAGSVLTNALSPVERLVLPSSRGFGRKLFYRHDEIELGVPYEAWVPCVRQVVELLRTRGYFSIIEVRFTPDTSRALLGPGVGRRTAFIELATPLAQPRAALYSEFERLVLAHGGQPHLGKATNLDAAALQSLYGQRFDRFRAVRARQDPRGKFRNSFTDRVFGPVP